MSDRLRSTKDKAVIIVKALPHLSSVYFETVCCAGIGRDQRWRRQYPVPFRVLADTQKFGRWAWIEYEFTKSKSDNRRESQKVVPESIQVVGELKSQERARFLSPLIRESTKEAEEKGETLTLLRPSAVDLSRRAKTTTELSTAQQKHARLVSQLSLIDRPVRPLDPCPYEFTFRWTNASGIEHRHTCDDWETSTAFFRRRARDGELQALRSLKWTYEEEYLQRGMVFALGTHSRRDHQWLLVGVIRLDEHQQHELLL